MKFSEVFEIALTGQEDWFDPVLNVDTEVYIDPFLIYADSAGQFVGAQDELIGYFEHVYRLLAASRGNRSSLQWRLAISLLAFPEAGEFCLGVSMDSTHGAGSGRGYATQIAEAMWEAIQIGLTVPQHFEEVELFRVGIGPDRISDALGTVLKHRFAAYTLGICEAHGIPTSRLTYARGNFQLVAGEWLPRDFHLPANPYNKDAILLAPRRYLRQLPTINSREFFHYCLAEAPELVAARLGFDIQSRVNKEEIVQLARENPELVRAYAASVEASEPDPYDFDRDPKGLYKWYDSTKAFAEANAQALPRFQNAAEFQAFIRRLCEIFASYVENNRGWELLWNDGGTSKPESAAQSLFLGIVKHYCAANDVDVSKETNLGRGPVDFKFAQGANFRTLLEVKLARNTRFWNGLEAQLPKYLEVEGISHGIFLVVAYTDADLRRIASIRERVAALNENLPFAIAVLLLDAQRAPPSASHL